MRKDDLALTVFFVAMLGIFLVAFAPVAEKATLTMRLWAIAESPAFVAIVGTFLSAFAGTWGAQLLAERKSERRALLTEIRGTNAAIGLAYNIANTYISTKKQFIGTLTHRYNTQVAERNTYFANPIESKPFPVSLDLQAVYPPFSPIDELQFMLREKISHDGRALVLLTPLTQSIRGFNETLNERNKWIDKVKSMPHDNDATICALYFGIQYAPGHTDITYPSIIKSLGQQVDDCIAFSILILESLSAYAEHLTKRYGDGAPQIPRPIFDRASHLLPDMSLYSDWVRT